jgi:HK97 family phage prohead protease
MTRHDYPAVELRSITTEVRMIETPGARPKIRGYAAVFNSRSQTLRTDKGDEFVETIRPGAFRRAVLEADVRGLIDHDSRRILGRRSAGTMKLWEDDHGLGYEIDAPDTSYARDLLESLRRGDISGSSFSFATIDDDWSEGEGGLAVRELRSVHLFDVGPVAFPAYLTTSATCRALDAFRESRSAATRTVPAPAITYPTGDQVALLNQLRLLELS